jgi:hypothetical protein
MPRITQVDGKEVKPYGVGENTNQKMFQERLLDRFKPHEYVKVINVDDEPFMWQYMPAENEEEEFTPDGMHRHIRRSDPEVWMLDPGESETIVGANAYLMIEGLYKKLQAKKAIATLEVKPGMARAFNFADGNAAEYWIDRILVGKEVPTFTSLNDTKAERKLPEGGETYESKYNTDKRSKQAA